MGIFKICQGSETSDMTSEGEMFEGDSADSMGGRAEGLACADLVARTPIGASGNFIPVILAIYRGSHYMSSGHNKFTPGTLLADSARQTAGAVTKEWPGWVCKVMLKSHWSAILKG